MRGILKTFLQSRHHSTNRTKGVRSKLLFTVFERSFFSPIYPTFILSSFFTVQLFSSVIFEPKYSTKNDFGKFNSLSLTFDKTLFETSNPLILLFENYIYSPFIYAPAPFSKNSNVFISF